MASLPTILLILAAISMGATVIAALIAFRSQKEASSAIFPIVREEENNRAQRARLSIFVWLAITALFFGGWLATLRLSSPTQTTHATTEPSPPATEKPVEIIAAEPTANTPVLTPTEKPPLSENSGTTEADLPLTPRPEPSPSNTAAATNTPVPPTPTAPPTSTPTPKPSATATNTPLPTPLPATSTPILRTPTAANKTATALPTPDTTIVPLQSAPISTRIPAPSGVRVGPIQFATEVTDNLVAVEPTDQFKDGVIKIYAVFPFKGMSQGLDYKVLWYKYGIEIARDEGKWEWGKQGKFFTFVGPQGVGLYKLDLYVNDSIVATKLFEIEK